MIKIPALSSFMTSPPTLNFSRGPLPRAARKARGGNLWLGSSCQCPELTWSLPQNPKLLAAPVQASRMEWEW